jgi:hypothetical protein
MKHTAVAYRSSVTGTQLWQPAWAEIKVIEEHLQVVSSSSTVFPAQLGLPAHPSLAHVDTIRINLWEKRRKKQLQHATAVHTFRLQMESSTRNVGADADAAAESWHPTLAGLIEVFCRPVGNLRRKAVKSV